MMMDNSISKKVNPGDFTLRDYFDFTKVLLNEISAARISLLLLAVFKVLHITATLTKMWWMFLNMKLHTEFYDKCLKFSSSLKVYFGHSKGFCCLMNMLPCH